MTLEQCWHTVPGGTATSAIATARALCELSVDVVGVAARHRSPPSPAYAPGVPLVHLPLPRLALYEAWQRLRRPPVQHATGAVDVIHGTTMAVPPRTAPLVLTVHDLAFLADPSHFTRRGLGFFARGLEIARRDADLVLVPSEAVRVECLAAGFSPERLRVVPHGVDVAAATDADVARVRAAYQLDGPYVLWTGTREPRKNLSGLLSAFSQLEADADLVVVGPEGWGEDLGSRLAATPRVRVTGFVPDADRDALYAGAELFLFPSLREGFGLPVLEAMAQGTPVVTSAGTAMAEFAVGALVEPTDSGAIARAVDELLADDARRASLGQQARSRAGSMTWRRAAETTLAAYRELLS
ncbi:MAG: glycosyl transferase, group 1 [Frankiales bacterium]|jgi:glycosyltransferase involved in cell wall biosynthesis|nr:glycosyl transferase, group 1 [Frankiales bacterium]